MVRLEFPKSLLGKHPYIVEQAILRKFINESISGILVTHPELFEMGLPIPKLLSKEKALKHFERAKAKLEELV